MKHKKLVVLILLVLVSAISLRAQEGDYRSGAIKTVKGYLLVWNEPDNYYTLEINGKEVRQTSDERQYFSVDKMFLQILTVNTKNFLKDAKKQKPDDKTILSTHMDWEVAYFEDEFKKGKLKTESSWVKLPNGKDALAWQFHVPEPTQGNVKKQIYLSVVKGDYVLLIGGVVIDDGEEKKPQQMLFNVLSTLKVSEKPIDLRKVQEAARKEAGQ